MTRPATSRAALIGLVSALLALLSLSASPARAAADVCPVPAAPALCSLHTAAGADQALHGVKEAEHFVALIAADRQLDDGEKRMAKALIDAADKGVDLVLPIPSKDPLRYGAPDKAAADTLRYFLTAMPNVERALGTGDDATYRALAVYYGRGISGLNAALVERCAILLDKDFRLANQKNGYKPYRDRVSGWYKRSRGWSPAESTAAREYLFACGQRHDEALAGAVPSFLYEWLKP